MPSARYLDAGFRHCHHLQPGNETTRIVTDHVQGGAGCFLRTLGSDNRFVIPEVKADDSTVIAMQQATVQSFKICSSVMQVPGLHTAHEQELHCTKFARVGRECNARFPRRGFTSNAWSKIARHVVHEKLCQEASTRDWEEKKQHAMQYSSSCSRSPCTNCQT